MVGVGTFNQDIYPCLVCPLNGECICIKPMLTGLGYTQQVREGVTVTLSTLIDGKNFNQGGHKVGLALELES